MIVCPCCKGEGHISATEDVSLTPLQRRIYDALATRPRTNIELQDAMYGDRPDGGPENGNTVVSVLVNQMKHRLRPHGMTVRSTGGPGALYRLEAL
jgi:hypothetical protein